MADDTCYSEWKVEGTSEQFLWVHREFDFLELPFSVKMFYDHSKKSSVGRKKFFISTIKSLEKRIISQLLQRQDGVLEGCGMKRSLENENSWVKC